MATPQVINKNQADEMVIEGFTTSTLRLVLAIFAVVTTGGLFLVLLTWRADLKLNILCDKVPLDEATKVLLKDKFGQSFEEEVHRSGNRIYFVNKKITYVWSSSTGFRKQQNIDETLKQADFYKVKDGLTEEAVADRFLQYGRNFIKISVPPVLHLLFHEALNPFYLFQAYTVILWTIQTYWKFAIVIAIASVMSVTASVWETRRQSRNLRDKMKSESMVKALREHREVELSSTELVPGDVILLSINGGFMMECDAVLIEGTCVVNESMLTGESIPITKIAIPNDEATPFNYDLQRQHVVFCGTEILQGKSTSGDQCKAVVIRTGFMTTKGELVRAILFPPPLDFKFHQDFLKSIYVFFILGIFGMSYSLYMWIQIGGTMNEILLNSLDILTFVVPPILPAALTANNAFAQRRLEKKGIFCLHSKHICLCGGIDIVAFDKTGTLTEGDLDLSCVVETKNKRFNERVSDPTVLPLDSPLIQAMATCHSLIKLNGHLTGNPLDVKLFEAIEWELTEQHNKGVNVDYGLPTPTLVGPPKGGRGSSGPARSAPSNLEIAVLKTYPFDSSVQRMTAVTKKKGATNFNIFIKGAPEKVASLCKPETVPSDFGPILHWYTKQGLRVIAAATKSLSPNVQWKEVDGMSRDDLEQKADFLGLIVMRNSVKEETYPAIKALHDADIESVMVTGDNILTAISVGRDCKLVRPEQTVIRVVAELVTEQCASHLKISYSLEDDDDSSTPGCGGLDRADLDNGLQSGLGLNKNYVFACDGVTFGLIRSHDRDLLDRIVHRGKIFARMLPEQKIHLIECMKDLGRQVVMCGDGCNDCGALKTAHAGISLSMAEASVAAPFTSRNVHIGCVPYLIREGRATMVSAFASFKFGVAFCFSQLIAVLMVFYIGTEPSDNQYLVVDIGLGALPIIVIGNCGPHHTLVQRKPTRHLLSFLPLFSVISFLLFQTLFYISVWLFVRKQPWFEPYVFVSGLTPPNPSFEQTYIFLMSCGACIVASVIFSKGAPYRKHLFTNGIMAAWLVAGAVTTVFLTLYDSEDFRQRLNMKVSPEMEFRAGLVGAMCVYLVFCYIWEVFFLDGIMFSKVLPLYKKHIRGPCLPFEHLEEELRTKSGWPPLGTCRNNEVKIAITVNSGSGKGGTITTLATPTNSDNLLSGSNVALRDHLRMASRDVKKSIKNRWSGGGGVAVGGLPGVMGSGGLEVSNEEQGLISGASELPFESPLPNHRSSMHQQQQQHTFNPNINNQLGGSQPHLVGPAPKHLGGYQNDPDPPPEYKAPRTGERGPDFKGVENQSVQLGTASWSMEGCSSINSGLDTKFPYEESISSTARHQPSRPGRNPPNAERRETTIC